MAFVVRLALGGLVGLTLVSPAAAQTASPAAPASSRALFPGSTFAFSWARMFTNDRRFQWDARVRMDLDVAEINRWHMGFSADYDAVIGRERRRFDLNQGTYILEGTVGRDVGTTRVAFLGRHVSRHLVDRENAPAISWNLAGARFTQRLAVKRTTFDGQFELGRAMQQAFVDYTWMTQAHVRASHPINPLVSFVGMASGEVALVDHLVRDRRVCGGRIEAALRFNGRAAAFEVVAGYERRIDGFPTDRYRVRAVTLGFRLAGR